MHQGVQDICHHGWPAEAHQQACHSSAVDNLAVLRPGSMTLIQVPKHRSFGSWRGHIWNKDMRWQWGFKPAVKSRQIGHVSKRH